MYNTFFSTPTQSRTQAQGWCCTQWAGSSHNNEHKLDNLSLRLAPLVILDCVKMTMKTKQFTKYV